jgi:hypothetical protein
MTSESSTVLFGTAELKGLADVVDRLQGGSIQSHLGVY